MRRAATRSVPVPAREIVAAPLLAVLLAATACAPPPRATGPLPHEAFVWQRAWTPEVLRAAESRDGLPLDGLVVLAAELTWDAGRPQDTRIAFGRSVAPAALAIRVETPPAWDDPGPLAALAAGVAAAHAPRELMIDLDAPESRLDAYSRWIAAARAAVRAAVPGAKLTITALPAWLSDARAFRRLARATDGFVLQVHSLEPPAGPGRPATLCDPARARAWIEAAAQAGVPFRVALPAYGYRARYDRAGKLLGLSADAPRDGSPDEVIADPVAMAGLVRDLTAERPELLRGVVWFRLPVSEDRIHWQATTLAEVIAGRVPRATFRGAAARSAFGPLDISLCNDGTADGRVAGFRVSWPPGAKALAGDGIRGFALHALEAGSASFVADPPVLVTAGECGVPAGWLAFRPPAPEGATVAVVEATTGAAR